MLFRDLLVSCKNWNESTGLIVVSSIDNSSVSVPARVARAIFGDRHVLWFRDCVVMLL